MTANYTSGSVSVHPVHGDGSLGARTDLVEHRGHHGPQADRQDGPHAHQVVFVDGGLLVCDLGLDAVVGYHLDDGRLTEVARSAMPAGSGPRHLVLDGATAYVLGELSSTVTVCDVAGLVLTPGETVSSRRPDAAGENTAAELVLVGGEVLALQPWRRHGGRADAGGHRPADGRIGVVWWVVAAVDGCGRR